MMVPVALSRVGAKAWQNARVRAIGVFLFVFKNNNNNNNNTARLLCITLCGHVHI